MEKRKQDDHIIIPKATLKRFKGNDNRISVLNLSDPSEIKLVKHFPKSFHTKKDYYDVDIDNQIKKIETKIGKWNKKLSKITQENINDINFENLKAFAIELITLQFHRCVMADSSLREAFIKIKLKEYSGISLNDFSSEEDKKEFLDNKLEFENAIKDDNLFIRYFQKNFASA